jgi:hypothetical protein
MAILADVAGLSMGNTCLLPLLTPHLSETGAGRVNSRADFCETGSRPNCAAEFSSNGPLSPQDVHSRDVLWSCGFGRFGCRVEETFKSFNEQSIILL